MRRHRVPVAATCAVVLALTIGLVASIVFGLEARDNAREAQENLELAERREGEARDNLELAQKNEKRALRSEEEAKRSLNGPIEKGQKRRIRP